MSKDKFYKKISNSECFYQVCENISPPFSLQMIVEGKGNITLERLTKAVKETSELNRGTRLILKKGIFRKYWVDTEVSPPVTEIDDSAFYEFNEKRVIIQASKNKHLYKRLDIKNGPTCEVILIKGKTTRVLFRALHSVMDARGLLFWAEEVFRLLREDKALGTNTTISDIDYYKSFEQKSNISKVPLNTRSPSPLGKKENDDTFPIWARKKIQGNFSGLVSQLAFLLTQESYKHQNNLVTFMISTDMRNNENNFRTTGNLSAPIYITVKKEDSWVDIYRQIISKFKNNIDKQIDKSEVIVHFLPINLLTLFLKRHLKKIYNKDSFLFSVAISNLGKVNPKNFNCKDFECTDIMFLPVDIPGFSISLICVELPGSIELFMSAPAFLASGGRLENLINILDSGLKDLIRSDYVKKIANTEEKKQIEKFNSTDTIYPKDKTVIDLFKEQVCLTPENVAASMNGENLTFKELNEKSDSFARYINTLEESNHNFSNVIALLATHSIETIICILGILKSGNAYLPIDPEQPQERILFMLKDANISYLVTNINNINYLSEERIIFINDNLFKNTDKNYKHKVNDLAYIMYTSGSTGKPKGVKVSNLNLLNYILWVKKYGLIEGEKTIYPFYTSLSFDLTITSIFLPLISGNQIEVYKNEYHKFAVKKIIEDKKANIIKLTPTHLKLMNELNNDIPNLKKIITLGENLSTDLANQIYIKSGKTIEIINQYGPTEATVGCMVHSFNPNEDKGLSVPIGIPGDNTYIYLLNEDREEVGVGQTGEIYISGDCVAQGYLNREDLTNERFINDPFKEGKIMYKTGDLALRLPNFEIEYLERVDDQVKFKGYRIELGEIQKALSKHKDIKDNVVIVKDKNNDSLENINYLIAYYKSEKEIDPKELKTLLSEYLPYYMIPSVYIHVKDIPLTVSGKTDKKALLLIEKENYEKNPNIKVEEKKYSKIEVSDISKEVKKSISKIISYPENMIKEEQNLFDLGIDSLSMTALFSILTRDLIYDKEEDYLIKNLDKLLKDPTVNNLINIIEKA